MNFLERGGKLRILVTTKPKAQIDKGSMFDQPINCNVRCFSSETLGQMLKDLPVSCAICQGTYFPQIAIIGMSQ